MSGPSATFLDDAITAHRAITARQQHSATKCVQRHAHSRDDYRHLLGVLGLEDTMWIRSSFCDANGCVEVARDDLTVRSEPTNGCTDDPKVVWVRSEPGGGCTDEKKVIRLRNSGDPSTEIGYTVEEFGAFLKGVKAGEYDHLVTS